MDGNAHRRSLWLGAKALILRHRQHTVVMWTTRRSDLEMVNGLLQGWWSAAVRDGPSTSKLGSIWQEGATHMR